MTAVLAASLVILAGGESKRMGRPKHLLSTPAGTILEHICQQLSPQFEETLVVGRDPIRSLSPGVRFIEDARPEKTPLVGIYSGLLFANTPLCFVVACDMPFVKPQVVQRLYEHTENADVAVPLVNSYYEPLCAFYRNSALASIESALDCGERKVTAIYDGLRIRAVNESVLRTVDRELVSFINLNTPRELSYLEELNTCLSLGVSLPVDTAPCTRPNVHHSA